jgi:hypothetical protein
MKAVAKPGMSKRALRALRGSIRKWEAIVARTGVDEGSMNCPLCAAYIDADCRSCPVLAKTHRQLCDGTPYRAFRKHQFVVHHAGGFARHWESVPGCGTCTRLANAELKFLKSLAPAAGPQPKVE